MTVWTEPAPQDAAQPVPQERTSSMALKPVPPPLDSATMHTERHVLFTNEAGRG